MRTIKREIVGGILFSNDEHILIGKNVKGGVYEDLWVIPGGGIDDGETKEQAVKREIFEEVGIDISSAELELLPGNPSRTAEKTLRDTGERVLVDMTFYDFKVSIDAPAASIPFVLEDDFGYAEWVPYNELAGKNYSPSTEARLQLLGLIA